MTYIFFGYQTWLAGPFPYFFSMMFTLKHNNIYIQPLQLYLFDYRMVIPITIHYSKNCLTISQVYPQCCLKIPMLFPLKTLRISHFYPFLAGRIGTPQRPGGQVPRGSGMDLWNHLPAIFERHLGRKAVVSYGVTPSMCLCVFVYIYIYWLVVWNMNGL